MDFDDLGWLDLISTGSGTCLISTFSALVFASKLTGMHIFLTFIARKKKLDYDWDGWLELMWSGDRIFHIPAFRTRLSF